MKDIPEKFIVGAFIGAFGAVVHVANQFIKAKRDGVDIDFPDSIALFITSAFSSLVFGIIALMLSDNELHFYLATATGAFMGLAGLTRVTDSAFDVVLTMVGKKK